MTLANRVGEAQPRREIVEVGRDFSRGRVQRIACQLARFEGLQIVAKPRIEREISGDAKSVLHEGRVQARVGMRHRIAEILHVIARNIVGIGSQRRQRLAIFHGGEGPGINLHVVEVIFAAE